MLLLFVWFIAVAGIRVRKYEATHIKIRSDSVDWQKWDPMPTSTSAVNSLTHDDGPYDPVPFCFPFYSSDGVTVHVSPNGFLSLSPEPMCYNAQDGTFYFCNDEYSGFYKLSCNDAGSCRGGDWPLVGGYVEDLDASSSNESVIRYRIAQKYDSQPVLVVEYSKVPLFNRSATLLEMQIELISNGSIIFRYRSLPPQPPVAFVGLVWTDVQYIYLNDIISPTSAVRFDPRPDPCAAYTTPQSCVTNKCIWCSNLPLCVESALALDFCKNGDYHASWPDTDVSGYYYTQTINYDVAPEDDVSEFTTSYAGETYKFFSGSQALYPSTEGFVLFEPGECLSTETCFLREFLAHGLAAAYFTGLLNATAIPPPEVRVGIQSRRAFILWRNVSTIYNYSQLRYSFGIIWDRDGIIRIRFFSTYAQPPNVASYANAQFCPHGPDSWVAYPTPTIGLAKTWLDNAPKAYSFVPWHLIRKNTEVVFTPLPNCPRECYNYLCNHTSQTCVCSCAYGTCGAAAQSNGQCTACNPNRAGRNCDIVCRCVRGVCSDGINGDGSCSCPIGWGGLNCDIEIKSYKTSSSSNTSAGTIIVVTIFSILIVCAVVAALVFCCMRREARQRQQQQQQQSMQPVGTTAVVIEAPDGSHNSVVVPIRRIPPQSTPVQGIPLQQIPMAEFRQMMINDARQRGLLRRSSSENNPHRNLPDDMQPNPNFTAPGMAAPPPTPSPPVMMASDPSAPPAPSNTTSSDIPAPTPTSNALSSGAERAETPPNSSSPTPQNLGSDTSPKPSLRQSAALSSHASGEDHHPLLDTATGSSTLNPSAPPHRVPVGPYRIPKPKGKR